MLYVLEKAATLLCAMAKQFGIVGMNFAPQGSGAGG